MKVAIVHLSDFHIRAGNQFLSQKTDGVLAALNVLGKVDDYIVVFSGDLSFSGQVNEFKKSRYLIGKLISGIKNKNDNKFVNLFMVPGNHDLCLPENPRVRKDIQEHYDNETIEELIPAETSYLENYYSYSNANGRMPYDIFLSKKYCTFDGYNIQFNLINTAPFSTLEPDDKELHYFPDSKINSLMRSADANLCITVMHHSYEWFNWNYKSNLEKAIIDNSELLLYGHDHRERTTSLSIDNSLDTWISSAGEMKFSSLDEIDSFNAIVIDTEANAFDGYVFSWDKSSKIYTHKVLATQKSFQNHSTKLMPLPSYIKSIKQDNYNLSDDFTDYFVFPKLVAETQNEFDRNKTATSIEELTDILIEKKKLVISGATNSGKTTLLKYLYCSLSSEKTPLFLSTDGKQRIKAQNFIRHLFEEQYGDDRALFEKYEQLDLDKKVLIIDGWDQLNIKNQNAIIQKIEEFFGYIIISVGNSRSDVVEAIKGEISDQSQYFELHIKPFFTEKRNELVRNICLQKSSYRDDDVSNVNRLIDSLVQNNSGLFSLNPAFIVRYTNCFIQDPYQDYTKGEAVFSKIFEFELNQSIMKFVKRQDADELFTAFEEVAGYMYTQKKDELPIEEVRSVIDNYNNTYGEHVNVKDVITIGIKAKILKETDDLSIYFINKNHLSYFIAKYLIRVSQGEPADISGIEYALENICFGINSDIVLFISYILNNTRILTSISNYAGKLLEPWDAIDLSNKNISLLHNIPLEQITPPTDEEKKKYETGREKSEEDNYSEEVIEAKGLFDYDDSSIDQYQYRLVRALKYTEMICKSLPAFHSKLKLNQKQDLVESIYLYPRKIVFALLRPLDMYSKEICKDILEFAEQNGKRKKDGSDYTNDDILRMLNDTARANMLSIFDHFSEIATSPKSFDLLMAKNPVDISESLERLLMIESTGNTDRLVKEADSLLKEYQRTEYDTMIRLIVRKHLLTNKELTYSKKQQVIDKIFGKGYRKYFLINKE